jgi:predicted permease
LLAGAGLLVRSFVTLEQQGPGFEVRNVWTGRLTLPTNRYTNGASWVQLESQAVERLRALPGVLGAGFTSVLPFVGNNNQGSVAIDGYTPPPGAPAPHAQHRSVDPGYFTTLGIPVIEGRNFAENETERVVIVDENVATRYWPEGNVLGQRVRVFGDASDEWWTIVGVVPAVKQASLAETPDKETMYWHYRQRPMAAGVFALRTALPPEQMTQAARAVVMELDPDLALYDTVPLGTRVLRSMGPQRAPMVLTLVFAAVAFTLAVIGVYGVIAWSVAQRIGDIGVRVALGARSVDVLRMVMTQGGKMIVIGLALGVVGALAIGRVLAAEMTAVRAIDPLVLTVAVGGLALAAFAATWVPARRAARIDPMQALRTE